MTNLHMVANLAKHPKFNGHELPEKLSDCITVAIKDLKKVERATRKYTVDMGGWHSPYKPLWAIKDLKKVERATRKYTVDMGDGHSPYKLCAVCFAGAVMAQTFKIPREVAADPTDFSEHNMRRFAALNYVRMGHIRFALIELDLNEFLASMPETIRVVDYDEDPARFKTELGEIAKKLSKVGL